MAEKIITFSGKQYSGKDTVAKIILENFKEFERIGIGDAIKIEYGKKHGLTFEEIEKLNILRTSLLSMNRACNEVISKLGIGKSLVLVDGNKLIPDFKYEQKYVVKGDAKSAALYRDTLNQKFRELGLPDAKIPKHINDIIDAHKNSN